MQDFKTILIKLNACDSAIEWVGEKSFSEAWALSERGDWMLWIAKKAGVNLRTLTAAKAECAALAIPYMKEPRSIAAVEAARAFGRGEISETDLHAYAASASAAAYADDDDAAYAAASAAYAAASAAYAAAYAASAAAYAAYAAYVDASASASASAARSKTLAKCAEIVRRIIPIEQMEAMLKNI